MSLKIYTAIENAAVGNESAPKQLAQCWFRAWAPWPFPKLKYKYILQIKYTKAILSKSTGKLLGLWFEITKMVIAV